jgi:hypothetical protein
MKKITVFVFLISLLYAVVRYHIGKEIPWSEFPFVLNKSLAFMATFLIGITILPESWFKRFNATKKPFGTTGYLIAIIHILLVISLVSPERYPLFYDNNEFTARALWVFATGILSVFIFTFAFIASVFGNVLKLSNQSKRFFFKTWSFWFNCQFISPTPCRLFKLVKLLEVAIINATN